MRSFRKFSATVGVCLAIFTTSWFWLYENKLDSLPKRTDKDAAPSLILSGNILSQFQRVEPNPTPSVHRHPILDARVYSLTQRTKLNSMFPDPPPPIPLTVFSDYLILNSHLCEAYPNLLYIVVVHTATGHFKHRMNLRETWANQTLSTKTNSRTVFLLGKPLKSEVQAAIVKENQQYGDMVQGDFDDTYDNLTLKAVMGLRWLTENCRNARYVIKTDDDVFLDIYQVIYNYFSVLDENPLQIICEAIYTNVIRGDRHVPWSISADYFRGMNMYPMPICHGYVAIFSMHLAVKLFEKARTTPFFRLDDVHVYGILASQIQNITWRAAGPNFSQNHKVMLDATNGQGMSRTALIVRSREMMDKLWTLAVRQQFVSRI